MEIEAKLKKRQIHASDEHIIIFLEELSVSLTFRSSSCQKTNIPRGSLSPCCCLLRPYHGSIMNVAKKIKPISIPGFYGVSTTGDDSYRIHNQGATSPLHRSTRNMIKFAYYFLFFSLSSFF
ncbi:hypothetical protein L5515_007432 [Caenorhabditis briggsae]|uniref:Uncharacterized protein n=1 Tax=Caenorhabditis briggsae TaxID=6238 RepID=A0AAE9JM72_CAEBR|nr:hypothetical protein L5515_007432 [Caenorhabditis briggsae]